MTDQPLLTTLAEGDEFVGFYVLQRCEVREFDGGARLEVDLADRSGMLPGVVWEEARELGRQLVRGSAVKVKGRLATFRDQPQVRVERIRVAQPDEFDPALFLAHTSRDMEDLRRRLDALTGSIGDTYLASLMKLLFDDPAFREAYLAAPGGMKWHHPYIGGLVEHSVDVAELCDFIAGRRPSLNRDLLVVAALLHDVGKLQELRTSLAIDYTDEGRLEGHIILGDRFVRASCDRIEDFPPRLKMLLSHLLLSHQGQKEFSSPVEPMIPEAFILYYADEIDAKLNALDRIAEKHPGKAWSDYIRLLGRFIYLGGVDGDTGGGTPTIEP